MYGKAYIQYSHQPNREWYLVSMSGNTKDLDHLMKYFLKKNSKNNPNKFERFYTHGKSDWMKGKLFQILERYGFKNIGPGDVKKETGKRAMDLSKLTEFEIIK